MNEAKQGQDATLSIEHGATIMFMILREEQKPRTRTHSYYYIYVYK